MSDQHEGQWTVESEIEATIKPCPKCGSKAILEGAYNDQIVCNGCGMWSGEDYDDLDAAIEWWNKQPYIDSLQAQIAALRQERDEWRQRHAECTTSLITADRRIERLRQELAALSAPAPEQGELLPCPFCGGKVEPHFAEGVGWELFCHACDRVHVGYFHSEREAIEFWNKRTPPAPEQGLDMPDSPGWWARDGSDLGQVGGERQFVSHFVRWEIRDDEVLFQWGDDEKLAALPIDEFKRIFGGKWHKLTMPWESPPAPAVPAIPDEIANTIRCALDETAEDIGMNPQFYADPQEAIRKVEAALAWLESRQHRVASDD